MTKDASVNENSHTIFLMPASQLSEVNSMLEEMRAQMYDALLLPMSILKSSELRRETLMIGSLNAYVMQLQARCISLLIAEIMKSGSPSSPWTS